MHKYEVGKPYSPTRRTWPEAVEYNFRAGGHELRMFLPNLSSQEIEAIKKGDCEFALYVDGPILFLLYRFEGFGPWSDTPYSWHLLKEQRPDEADLPEEFSSLETRALLSIVLVEATTGIVKALRAITFSPDFTQSLHAAIHSQAVSTWVGREAYDRHQATVYQRFLMSINMVHAAQARTKGGE